MSLIVLSLFISATFVTCTQIEENDILPVPIHLESSRALLEPPDKQGNFSVKTATQFIPEPYTKLGKIRIKRGGCCQMMMPPPAHPSKTYTIEIKAQPPPPPRARPPSPPPPPPHPPASQYVLVPVAVVQPVAVHPVHPPPRPPRMQYRPMYHPPSRITITGTITKNNEGGCPMRPH